MTKCVLRCIIVVKLKGDDMSRLSGDEIKDGVVFNGFDYELQVWVEDGKVLRCGHKFDIDSVMGWCCNGARYEGQEIAKIEGHGVR